nr:hypothetical protein [Staphylococcus pseudintermedius]
MKLKVNACGGGYIRITKVETKDQNNYIKRLMELIGPALSQQQALYIIDGLRENQLITDREAKMIAAGGGSGNIKNGCRVERYYPCKYFKTVTSRN